MSESVHTNTSLWSKGMKAVIVAQFLSAFGDNALLFATLALLKAQFYPEWSQPILQMVFVGAYILFAPFVGQVADSFAKGRVMMFANGLKLLGAAVSALVSIRFSAIRWWVLVLQPIHRRNTVFSAN